MTQALHTQSVRTADVMKTLLMMTLGLRRVAPEDRAETYSSVVIPAMQGMGFDAAMLSLLTRIDLSDEGINSAVSTLSGIVQMLEALAELALQPHGLVRDAFGVFAVGVLDTYGLMSAEPDGAC